MSSNPPKTRLRALFDAAAGALAALVGWGTDTALWFLALVLAAAAQAVLGALVLWGEGWALLMGAAVTALLAWLLQAVMRRG